MKRFAVGVYSLHDNELRVELIHAPTWQEAVFIHSLCPFDSSSKWNTIEECRAEAFELDGGVDVVEVPQV